MTFVSTCLSFNRNAEEAFMFYKDVFKTELDSPGLVRYGDLTNLKEADKKNYDDYLIQYVSITIPGGHQLVGHDISINQEYMIGNNSSILINTETQEEAEQLFRALSAGGNVLRELKVDELGHLTSYFIDKFGTSWMVQVVESK